VRLTGTNVILQVGCIERRFHKIVLLIGNIDILQVGCIERNFQYFGGTYNIQKEQWRIRSIFSLSCYSFQLFLIVSENRRVTVASNNVVSAERVMQTSQTNCVAHIATYSQDTVQARSLGAN
jgi:hypothetical protein